MTVTRVLFLFVMTLSPLSVWGQVLTDPRSDESTGNGDQFAAELGANSGPGAFSGSPAAFLQGQGGEITPGSDLQPQPGMGQSPQQAGVPQNGIPPELMSRGRQHYTSPIWQTTLRGGYFGVMGAIAQPGVYFYKNERVTLGEILKLAGGATAEASGGVRIVRQGRGGLQTFLSPDSRYELLNGDVIMLESNRRPGLSGLRQFSGAMHTVSDGAQRQSSSSKQGPSPSTHLAFVNLTPQPIVVPVPGDQATLTAVLTWLRQDLKSPPYVRVIAPSPQLRRDERIPVEQQLLENGTVLVFDPATVKKERLPEFPAAIGASDVPPAEQIPAAVANPPVAEPQPMPDIRPTFPKSERPAGRATRSPPPVRVPAPPPEPDLRAVPRRELGQQDQSPVEENRSSFGGPLLMMPQKSTDGNRQATGPDINVRPALPPRTLEQQPVEETTATDFQGNRVSWRSRPGVRTANPGAEVVGEQGVIQAHGERGVSDTQVQIGSALELPRPVPNLVPDAQLIQQESPHPSSALIRPSTSIFGRQLVWFSLVAMSLLIAILWGLFRWDGARPVHARMLARRNLATEIDRVTARKGRSVLMAERQQIFRTDMTPPPPQPVSTPAAAPTAASGAGEAAVPGLPPPIRTISQREHALRAHFRQAWKERGQHQTVPVTAENPSDDFEADEQSTAPQVAAAPIARPPASTAKAQDVLQRALQAKRNSPSAE